MSDIVPFGKYQGKPVEALLQDRSYVEWLLNQAWFRDKFSSLYTVIINYGQEPAETPEHNAMQAKFLGESYRVAFSRAFAQSQGQAIPLDAAIKTSGLEFEREGIDVRFHAEGVKAKTEVDHYPSPADLRGMRFWSHSMTPIGGKYTITEYWVQAGFSVEIKPSVGDDFPAVLRQMLAHRGDTKVLLVGQFAAVGVTFDQMCQMFAKSRITVITQHEVEEQLRLLSKPEEESD
jgi:uncharacterized protein (DUF3820 family)